MQIIYDVISIYLVQGYAVLSNKHVYDDFRLYIAGFELILHNSASC